MALLQSTDRLLVQRSGASYRATFEELLQSIGINPGGDLDISGDLDVSGSLILGTPNSGCSGTLAIHNATTVACTLDVDGASTFANSLGVTGALTGSTGSFSSTLGASGAATFGSTVAIAGATTIAAGGISVTGGTSSDTLNVSGLSTLALGVTAGSTLNVVGATTLQSTLDVAAAATFGSTVVVDGTTLSKGALTVQDNAAVTGDVSANAVTTVTSVTAGTSLAVGSTAAITGDTSIGGDVNVGAGKATVTAASGDADFAGTVTAAFFAGDGSQLTNLQIPGSLDFKGSIDCVADTAPGSATSGDFYLNTGTGSVRGSVGWTGIEGTPIAEGEFVYFSGTEWAIGGGNDAGFVTVTTAQTITGGKTFSSPIIATGGLSAAADISGTTLTLSSKATSADTVAGDAAATLTTKGYVDARTENSKTEEVLKSGAYLSGGDFDGSAEITFDVEGTEAATPLKLVARDVNGDIAANDVTVRDYLGRDIVLSNKLTAASSEVATAAVTGTATVNVLDVTTSAAVGTTLDVTGLLTGTTADFSVSVASVAYTGATMDLTGALTAASGAFTGDCAAATVTASGLVSAGTFNIDALDALPVTP